MGTEVSLRLIYTKQKEKSKVNQLDAGNKDDHTAAMRKLQKQDASELQSHKKTKYVNTVK